MKRDILSSRPACVANDAPAETQFLARVVARIASGIAYQRAALPEVGPRAIEIASRGRTLRALAKATGLSPSYLSLVANGETVISPAALLAILCECEGAYQEPEDEVER